MNTGLSRTVENTLSTSWSNENEISMSQDLNYEINVGIAQAGASIGFALATTLGIATIGATSNVEEELQPEEAVTAVLTATVGHLKKGSCPFDLSHRNYGCKVFSGVL